MSRKYTCPLAVELLESRELPSVYFVAPNGNDSNSGSSQNPWLTLQKAANTVRAGDDVNVRPGYYVGFDLRTSGTAANRIRFLAEPGVLIDTRNARTPDGINLEGASYIDIEGFTVYGMPRTGIRSVLNRSVTIRGNYLDSNRNWGVLTGFTDDVLIEYNWALNSQVEHGIYVSNSGDRPVIRANYIYNNRANGIHMNGDLSQGGDGIITGAVVEQNIIVENGRGGGSGINGDGIQDSLIQNNLIYNTHASGISLYRIDGGDGSKRNVVVHNTVMVAADGRWALNVQDGSTGNLAFNNIFFSEHPSRGSIAVSANSLPGFYSDFNAVMNRMSANGGSSVQTLTQWRAATGSDWYSVLTTPAALFVNPANGDYHLRAGSPAIDTAYPLEWLWYDLDWNLRPSGAGWDMGAYEYVGRSGNPGTSPTAAVGFDLGADTLRFSDGERRGVSPPVTALNRRADAAPLAEYRRADAAPLGKHATSAVSPRQHLGESVVRGLGDVVLIEGQGGAVPWEGAGNP